MDTTTPATPAMIGKYTVLRVLGRGGMGEVLLAEDDLGRRVAIKRPFQTASGEGLARFKIEARAATLRHENIPVVYEMGMQDDGLPFIAMEFVEGEPLDKMISSGKPIDLMLKLRIVAQVCAGLGYAHAQGIIHRDIKPANVIVLPNGIAKIIDFGIAKITNVEQTSELTQASQIIGSLHYIAPERFKAETVDGRVDIFSAGVILYLLLTGTLPFAGGEMTASYRIVNEAHTSLATHIKDYPKALDGIMDKALAKNPEDRYSSAEDFADALQEVIDDLKRSKVSALFSDAERLTMEGRYEPALELLDEAKRLDNTNTQVRKLHRMVREHQDRRKKQDRFREYVVKADSLLAAENYSEALTQLKEAQRVDGTSTDLRDRIAFVEDKKNRYDRSVAALTEVEAAKNRGDVTLALSIAERAVEDDPDNTKLLAVRGAISKQLEREATQAKVVAILDKAQLEFSRKNFTEVETLLAEAAAIDGSQPRIEELRSELARTRELDERRQLMDEIQRRVNDYLRGDNYEQASELLNRAMDKLPSETTLHRLKMEVDTAARKFDSARFIEGAISSARQTFTTDPQRALANLRTAIEQMPGEDRLVEYERTLRQQADTQRKQQMLSDALRNAREQLAARQPEQAITVLEAYQLENGTQADVDELLKLARRELLTQQRRALIEKTTAEVRTLVSSERLDEAASLLESTMKNPVIREAGDQTSDRTLSGLLEDVRQQQAAALQKLEIVRQRAVTLRERGQLDDAIQVLKEYLASSPRSKPIQDLLASIQAEWEIKRVTTQAVAAAAQASQQSNFAAAFEHIHAVVRAYGDSDELTAATEQVKAARAAHAQEIVSQSITTSRAALLANDVSGALDELRKANEWVEFADAEAQANWRRIGQAAKKAQAEPPVAGAAIADPLADLPELENRKQSSPMVLILGIVAVCIALAVAGVFLFRKQPPPGPTDAHLSISKAPAGALLSIDGGAKQPADASGSLTVKVTPGQHVFEVTKDGFDPFTDKFQVLAGGSYAEATPLAPAVIASKAGTLAIQSNLAGFKVFIDGRPTGEIMKKDGTRTLAEGKHTVRYTNEDGTDSVPEHEIEITAGKVTPDTVALKAPTPPPPPPPGSITGGLSIETTANAIVSIDGKSRGPADGAGRMSVASLPVGPHTIDLSLDKYQPISGKSVTVAQNQVAHFSQPLTVLPPPPPSLGSLLISTNPGATVSLGGQPKGTADGSGQLNLPNLAPGSYQVEISLDHYITSKRSVTIVAGATTPTATSLAPEPPPKVAETHEPPPPPQPKAETPAVADNSANIQGIKAALNNFVGAYRSKNLAAIQANWLNIGPARSKQIGGALQVAEVVNVSETCDGEPTISGNTATQNCVESYQFIKSDPVRKANKVITFAKVSGKWIMKDKNP